MAKSPGTNEYPGGYFDFYTLFIKVGLACVDTIIDSPFNRLGRSFFRYRPYQ